MGLYLFVLDEDKNEIEGVEVGSYADFGRFRDAVRELNMDEALPTLLLHSNCDGEWTPADCARLLDELTTIRTHFEALPPRAPPSDSWLAEEMKRSGIRPKNLDESFFDVNGENLIDQLVRLARAAIASGRPILFQ
jgi:hypothetical protein